MYTYSLFVISYNFNCFGPANYMCLKQKWEGNRDSFLVKEHMLNFLKKIFYLNLVCAFIEMKVLVKIQLTQLK